MIRAEDLQQEPDLYELLGVPPEADRLAIEAAHAALARRCSPEDLPQESRRIQHARDVLLDPERRALHDAWCALRGEDQEQGPELESLQQALLPAAQVQGALWSARRLLEGLLERAPERGDARRALALVLLEVGDWKAAEAHLRSLIEAAPGSPALRCQLIRALLGARRTAQAGEQAEQACSLAGHDPGAHALAGEAWMLLGRYDEARRSVRRAIELERGPYPSPWLVRRRAEIELAAGDADAAAEVLISATQALPRGAERRDALSALAGGAAMLFEVGAASEANRLLAVCAEAEPGCCPAPVPLPASLRREELPAPTRRWVEEQRKRPEIAAAFEQPYVWAQVGIGIIVLFLAGLCLSWYVSGCTLPRASGRPAMAVGLAALLAVPAGVVWWVVRAYANPFGAGLVLHPLHLLAVARDRLQVVPLLRVCEVEVFPRVPPRQHAHMGLIPALLVRLDSRNPGTEVRIYGEGGMLVSVLVHGNASELADRIRRQVRRVRSALSSGTLHRLGREGDFPPALFAPMTVLGMLADLRLHRLALGGAVVVAISFGVIYGAAGLWCG